MKCRFNILVIYIFYASIGHAQNIIIQPPVFAPFECTEFYKLYTGTVTNFTEEAFKTQLLVEVEYTSPGGVTSKLADGIITGNPSIDFKPGVTIVDNASYESIYKNRKITFYNKEIEDLLSRTKCLPPGQYDVCLSLYPAGSSGPQGEYFTQTCYTRDKEMLSQLLLLSPFEGEEIRVDLPLFTWTAVTPFNSKAMYRIQIVEVLANQTPYHAFRANPIFYEKTGLRSNIMQYPVSARPMLPCRKYAWRVTYELEGGFGNPFRKAPDFLQESELWEYSTPCLEEERVREQPNNQSFVNPVYYKTSIENSGNYVTVKGDLIRFTCTFPYKEKANLEFAIYNQKMELESANIMVYNEVTPNDLPDLPTDEFYGDNKYVAELPANILFDQPYILVVSNTKTKQYLRFKRKQ
ncbi:MAG: hypothetical protein IPN29_20345 [Saprospiraceae bacterium]|nr:hypothetical protein [Saprospiraceae bacterium]